MLNKLTVGIIAFFLGLTVFGQVDPVIMTINDQEITKSEFLQIYLKNNNDPKYDSESLDEYMELFKRFKLKVAEAEALGYDTIPKLMKELNGYKKQLALPYLVDSAMNESLVKEAYERTKMEVRASHIMLKVDQNASPKDTLEAYNALLDLKKQIEAGKDFHSVATGKNGSQDPSVHTNGGDLGFFNAFQMVYPFEDMAYKTPVGKISMPFRTRFGYHILQVTDKRPARGTIETAHIMVSIDKTQENPDEVAKAKIDEIYALLEAGENFEDLVAKYSDDPSSNKKDGLLPVFGTGATTRMVPEFEDAAFALKNDGDYSKPVRTSYGYHIVKRIRLTPVPSFEEMKSSLESKVAKDERSKSTQDSFVAKLKKEYKYKDKSKKGLKWFYAHLDTSYQKGKFKAEDLTSNLPLFTLDGKNFTQKEFAEFLQANYRGIRSSDANEIIRIQYPKWEKQAILDYEESKLVSKYPAYKALVTEYHDGILLYEIMSDEVWNKAMKDTTGLKEFYEGHKGDYQWGNRIDADIYECQSMEIAHKAYTLLLENDTLKPKSMIEAINEKSELNARHRSGKFDIEKTAYLKSTKFTEGINKPFMSEGKAYVVNVRELLPPGQKEFNEAKGAITSDYQNYLEKEWLKKLEQKHKVVINKEVLYAVGK